jgi:hypothetical protein
MKTEKEMREYAIGAAAYWLDCSEHEQTPEDAKILARYARLAIDRIVELETALEVTPRDTFYEGFSMAVNRHVKGIETRNGWLDAWNESKAKKSAETERSEVPKPKAEGSIPESSKGNEVDHA